MATAIRFQSVTKRFRGGTLALDGATWEIEDGSRACLLGPNGAGKSTSIRLLQAALAPTAGEVTLLDAIVGGRGYAAARRRCGIVPQQPGMYKDLKAGEYLRLTARLYGRELAGDIVEAFGLTPHLDKRMAQLSGGLQRRLVLAAALVGAPEVLLLDEPTVGLDPVAARDVHEFLREYMQGRTTLLCTHNLQEAQELCDEVVILREGRVVVQGDLEQLRRRGRPRLRLTARQGPKAIAAHLDGVPSMVEGDGRHLVVEVDSPEADAPRLLRALLGAGIDVTSCEPVEATLTDVFLEAVEESA
ncbi:MAG: ABC transporter ATP-binding protein [Candidatus Dormibacteraeota bacterium]|nr:ABC transporter ATP-binding protein [Candidatus Dormibacteraeota bacterium]